MMDAVWGNETSWGANVRTSGKGAKGNFQMLDGTASQYGVKIGDFDSEAIGAGHMLSDSLRSNGGDVNKALAAYNWGQGNLNKDLKAHGDKWMDFAPKETRDYINKADKSMGIQGDLVVNLHQTVTTPGGGTKTKKISTKLPLPTASGSQTQAPYIIDLSKGQ
jgi:soluble lytic murein transglycosylase-like protein